MMIKYVLRIAAILAFIGVTMLSVATPVVHADGGAPNLAYVAGAGKGIGSVDVQAEKMTSNFSVPGNPHAILLSIDGRFLYAAQPALHQVSILSAKTGQNVCSQTVSGSPTLLAFDTASSSANSVYVGANDSSQITIIDPNDCHFKGSYQVGGPVYGMGQVSLGTSSGGTNNQLWVSTTNAIVVISESTGKIVATVPVAGGPRYLDAPPGGTIYAVTAQGSVDAIDLQSPYTVTRLVSGGTYGVMDFDESTGNVYVPDLKNHQVVVIAPVDPGFQMPKEPLRVIHVQSTPEAVAITNDGQLGFVSLANGEVNMYDVPANQLITTVNVGGAPLNIITGLYPPALGTTPQQASVLDTLAQVAGYLIVAALLIVPIILFRRYAKAKDKLKKEGEEQDSTDPSDTADKTV